MTLNKQKVNTNQNLIPASLTYKYLYQRTIVPALIVVIAIVFLCLGAFYGSQSLTEKYEELAVELQDRDLAEDNTLLQSQLTEKEKEKDSLKETYENYYKNNPFDVNIDESILVTLNSEIARLEEEIKKITNDDVVDDVLVRYHIEELLLYIDSIRTPEIIIVSIEDQNSSSATGNQHLVYVDDVGNVSFSLHGVATSSESLSSFLLKLNSCEYLQATKIVSIETQSMANGDSLFAFEIGLTPRVAQ